MNKEITIGLFGFGCVGKGLYDVLNASKGFKASIKTICVKHREKKRDLPSHFFTFNKEEILNDPAINTVVELIDDADEAYHIVKGALQNGKNVVTANKKMLAYHLEELVGLQKAHKVSLLYEASVCGSIPIVRNLEEYYDNDLLSAVSGIFNGSSNYILTKISQEGWDYFTALDQAQALGFAETDPTLDVGGFDPKFKLAILAYHSFGVYVHPDHILNLGIQHITADDQRYAKEKGLKIKLVPTVQKINDKIVLFVLPQLINNNHYLYNVENEYNGVSVEAAFACTQTFIGKGAGGHPTGSAVLSDISALQYGYKYEYKKQQQGEKPQQTNEALIEVYIRHKEQNLFNALGFQSVTECYSARGLHYVKGLISLEELALKKELIASSGAFVAVTDAAILPVASRQEYMNGYAVQELV